jgi:hypothetical protein
MRERSRDRFNRDGARIAARAGISLRTTRARIACCLPSDQLIDSFFCATGAFFGSVNDSTPSW